MDFDIELKKIADVYKENLNKKIEDRRIEMDMDDNAHYIVYNVLGIETVKGMILICIKIRDAFYINMLVLFVKMR